MSDRFDLIVIGAGPGGYVAAIRAAQLGMKTAIVERENLGGVCLNWGCIPTKALLKSGEVYEQLDHLKDYGLSVTGRSYDFTGVVERSRKVAKQLSSGVAFLMKKNKVEVVNGTARLEKGAASPAVAVTLNGGGERRLEAKSVILATGARARVIPAVGLAPDGDRIWTYREAMVPKAAPKSLLVIGSGAIGVEFASFYRALGADVTVVEALSRILPVEDEEISAIARKAYEKRGLKFHVGAKVASLKKTAAGVAAEIDIEGKHATLEAEVAIVAVGIEANVENIGLEALGVKMERGHVATDAHLATNVPGLYAIGDVVGAPWLAHKASHEAIHCVEHIAGKDGPKLSAPIPGLHLRPAAGGQRRPHRGGGDGGRLRDPCRALPVPGERQGDRQRRNGRPGQDGVRRGNRRAAGRAHGRRRGDRDDPRLRPGDHHGGDRGGSLRHRLPAPDHERGHARGQPRRLRAGAAPVIGFVSRARKRTHARLYKNFIVG